jgi:NodT family efflux transporter outer membrane factor (OMF) lipoprotein
MSSKRLAITLLLPAGLFACFAGCEVGPDYHPPQVTVRPDFAEAPSTRPVSASIDKWWTVFHDPELNSLIDRGINNNLDLQAAESRLRQARAERGIAESALYPTANVGAGYQIGRGSKNVIIPAGAFGGTSGSTLASPLVQPAAIAAQPAIQAAVAPVASSSAASSGSSSGAGVPLSPIGLGGLPGTETQLYQAGFDASWEIDVFGGARRGVEAADADTAAALEDRRAVMVSLVAEVARNYIELRANQRKMQIATDNLHSQEETLDLTRSRQKAGFATDLDVARQSAQVAATASTIPAYDALVRQSMHQIAILLGEDPDQLSDELSTDSAIPPSPPQVPVGVPVELLRRRPDIRRAEREVAAASARIGVAEAELYPQFSLTGQFGLDATKPYRLVNWDSRYFAINPTISWPIFDAGRIRSNIAAQKEVAVQAALNYQQTVLQALGEVEDSLASYRDEQLRYKALQDSVDASQQAFDLARQQYQRGVIDFLTVLDAQRTLFEAQTVAVESQGAISTDLVSLYKSLGGGWDMDQVNSSNKKTD